MLVQWKRSREKTTIQALNDDCLFEIFKYLGVLDLSSIAETSSRFKQTVKAYFAYSKKKNLDFRHEVVSRGDTHMAVVTKTARVLRNFGEFIVEYDEGGMVCLLFDFKAISPWPMLLSYERKITELLVKYASETLRELKWGAVSSAKGYAYGTLVYAATQIGIETMLDF